MKGRNKNPYNLNFPEWFVGRSRRVQEGVEAQHHLSQGVPSEGHPRLTPCLLPQARLTFLMALCKVSGSPGTFSPKGPTLPPCVLIKKIEGIFFQ